MSEEKPLHVRVAEALGRQVRLSTDLDEFISDEFGDYLHFVPGRWIEQREHGSWYEVPEYDTDWSATGPLIEKYGVTLENDDDTGWSAYTGFFHCEGSVEWDCRADGKSPLRAVCHLILALKAAGRLDA